MTWPKACCSKVLSALSKTLFYSFSSSSYLCFFSMPHCSITGVRILYRIKCLRCIRTNLWPRPSFLRSNLLRRCIEKGLSVLGGTVSSTATGSESGCAPVISPASRVQYAIETIQSTDRAVLFIHLPFDLFSIAYFGIIPDYTIELPNILLMLGLWVLAEYPRFTRR